MLRSIEDILFALLLFGFIYCFIFYLLFICLSLPDRYMLEKMTLALRMTEEAKRPEMPVPDLPVAEFVSRNGARHGTISRH